MTLQTGTKLPNQKHQCEVVIIEQKVLLEIAE